MADALDLRSVHAKIARAEEHGHALQREMDAWKESRPNRLVPKFRSDKTQFGVTLAIDRPADFERWGLMIGDAFHNLRSCLDHLVFSIAAYESKGEIDNQVRKQLMFVIKDRPADFRSSHWHIASLSTDVRTAIERVQPYNRPHELLPPLLAVLRDFDDTDKHQLLPLVMTKLYQGGFSNLRGIPDGEKFEVVFGTGNPEDGATLAGLVFTKPTPDVKYNFDIEFTIAVEHARGPAGSDASGVTPLLLEVLVPEVKSVIDLVTAAVG